MKIRILMTLCILAGFVSTADAQFELKHAFPKLPFLYWPVDIQNAGDGSNRLFVIEEDGVINVFRNDPNVSTMSVFLDIKDKVSFGSQYGDLGESGLVSLAFHPNYENNGYFYVNYLGKDGYNIIARYTVKATNPDSADPNSEHIIAGISFTQSNKHVNQIAFGPDGYLYIATGDDESDFINTTGKAQSRQEPHGKILRIDVDHTSGTKQYSIPADNPYRGNSSDYLEEIYALGFRNPRKISFDPEEGLLWVSDSGWLRREEINIVENGGNYGWNVVEGSLCLTPPSGCSFNGLTAPVYEYVDSTQGNTKEVLGGILYRGEKIPELNGTYIYAEKSDGRIYRLTYSPGGAPESREIGNLSAYLVLDAEISGFGTDEAGEFYIIDISSGGIYSFKETVTDVPGGDAPVPSSFVLEQNYPNPFNPATTIRYTLEKDADVELAVYDVTGRLVRELVGRRMSSGAHQAVWDGRNNTGIPMSSGIYLYRLKAAGTVIATRRMVLLK